MIVEAAAICIGLFTAVSIVVPSVCCCLLWTRLAARRVYFMQQEVVELQAMLMNATIRNHLQQPTASSGEQPLEDDDREFPEH